MTTSQNNIEKRKERQKQTAEVFTPNKLVNQMLSKLPKEVWKKGKTFCDPSCGNGQFIIWILIRKIQRNHKPLEALKTIYGADIMKDNILECRMRLLKIVSIFEDITEEHIKTVFQNIVWININKHPTGSLEYDFSFKNKISQNDVDRWMKNIHKDNILDEVELPVAEETFTREGSLRDLFEE